MTLNLSMGLNVNLRKMLLISWALAACCVSPLSIAFLKNQINFLPLNIDKEKQVGPYYKAVLPTSIYLNSVKPDLSDIRIKNVDGDYLAYAFMDEEPTTFQMSSAQVPIFPFYADYADGNLGFQEPSNASVMLSIQKDGSLKLTTNSQQTSLTTENKKSRFIKGWIIDTSQLVGDSKSTNYLLQAQVKIAKENNGIADFSLQSSEDLQHWTSTYVTTHQQLVQLQHQGETIQKLSIDLYNGRAKYWRLIWSNPENAFDIKTVRIISQEKIFPSSILSWSTSIAANKCDQHACDYTLPHNTPIDSLRIQLGDVNTLTKMTIIGKRPQQVHTHRRRHLNPLYLLHRRDKTSHYTTQVQEEYLNEATVYRLQLANDTSAETQSDDIALNGQTYTHLRLITQSDMRSLGKQLPSIQIGTLSRSIVFLARGKEPYSVQWGEENPIGAALPLTTLMPDATQALHNQMGEAQLAPISSVGKNTPAKIESNKTEIETKSQEKNQHKYWFWAVLGVGLLLLGAMVWSFLKGMKDTKEDTFS